MGPANLSGETGVVYEDHHDKMIDLLQGASWAPDGKKFAFAMTPWSDIYTFTLGQSDSVNLTKTDKYFEMDPAWSPNGKLIAFVSDRRQVKGTFTSDLYSMRPDGSGIKLLVECAGECHHPEWSPDGKQIVFQMDKDLYLVPAGGGKPKPLVQGGGVNQFPAWSPDGEKIAFIRSVAYDSPSFIYFVRPDGSELTAITGKLSGPRQLSWSPDGKYLAFENFPPKGISGNISIQILELSTGVRTDWHFGYTPAWRPFDPAKIPYAAPAVVPTASGSGSDCSAGWSRLQVGGQAVVAGSPGDTPNRVREKPDTSSRQIGSIKPGTVLSLLEGPICANGLVFWKFTSPEIPGGFGWTAEGDGEEYWLNPYP